MNRDCFWDDVADSIIAEPDEDKRKAILARYHESTRANLEAVIKTRVNKQIQLLEKLQYGTEE